MPSTSTYRLGPVKSHVAAAANEIGPKFGIRTIGGYRAQGSVSASYHPLGRALDLMCNKSQGDQIVAYAMANKERLGIIEIIWWRRIATASRGWSWRSYSGPSAHTDHVHLSFSAGPGTGGAIVPGDPNAAVEAPGPTVATWNILKSNSVANIVTGLKAIITRADVISLQEVRDNQRPAINALMASLGYASTTSTNAVPIYVRKSKYTIVGQGDVKAVDSAEATKHISWVKLQDLQGNQLHVVNNHIMAGIESRGMIGGPHVDVYETQMNALIQLVSGFKATGAPVIVTGDFNIDATRKTDLTTRMQAAGFTSNWQTLGEKPTHGSRTIDYVWSLGLTPQNQQVDKKYGSDHSPVIVGFGGLKTGILNGLADVQAMAQGFARLLSWMTNAQNWYNLLMIIAGAMLVLFALWRMGSDEAFKIVKKVVK